MAAAAVFAAAHLVRPESPAAPAIGGAESASVTDARRSVAALTGASASRWLGRPDIKSAAGRGAPSRVAQAFGPRAATPPLVQPMWRPAGEVLRRKSGASAATAGLPLAGLSALTRASEPRDTAHRESLSRWHSIYTYSTRYRIKTDLSRRIYDAAVDAGIEPELGFRLVRVESEFRPQVVSRAGAIGLTQLMLNTARVFEPGVTRAQLMEPDVNLRIGFRYLRTLIRDYKGDLKLALLAYNRGPTAVHSAISMGLSPANGYESVMLRGYRGRGTLD